MKLLPIMAERWKADGGAVFGVVPKTIWRKFYEPDEQNNVPTCSRCLLVDTGEKIILFDTGMGNKQDEKFYRFRFLYGDDSLEKSFSEAGYRLEDVTDIVFTHLHYDHVGGAFRWNEDKTKAVPVFPNAHYWCSRRQWEWATHPNVREGASYIPENQNPIFESEKLHFIENEGFFAPKIYLKIFHGHTDGQIIPVIEADGKKFVFTADFIPTTAHLPLPYVPAYDTRPLLTMEEKARFLEEAVLEDYCLVFQHDPIIECCTLIKTEKGVREHKRFALKDAFNY